MSAKEEINTYLLVQFDNEQLASKAHSWLEAELELEHWEIAHVNECCLIMLSPDSEITLDELTDKIFKLPGVGTFDLHIARAGIKGDKEYFEEIGHLASEDFKSNAD